MFKASRKPGFELPADVIQHGGPVDPVQWGGHGGTFSVFWLYLVLFQNYDQ